MNIHWMYDYFELSGDEEVVFSTIVLEEGFEVNITLPDRISDEQIAHYFYENVRFDYLCGMNKRVGNITVPVKTTQGTTMDISFNRITA